MTHRKLPAIDGGSAAYWQQRRIAFGLIRAAEQAGQAVKDAPMYRFGVGYDEYGDRVVEENLEPHDAFEEALRRLQENETAVSILVTQGRDEIHGFRLDIVHQRIVAQRLPYDDEVLVWVEPYGFIGPNTD